MMGIVVSETCWAYKKYNKNKWYLVGFYSSFKVWYLVWIQTENIPTSYYGIYFISLKLDPLGLNDFIPCFNRRKMKDLTLISNGILHRLDEEIISLKVCKWRRSCEKWAPIFLPYRRNCIFVSPIFKRLRCKLFWNSYKFNVFHPEVL